MIDLRNPVHIFFVSLIGTTIWIFIKDIYASIFSNLYILGFIIFFVLYAMFVAYAGFNKSPFSKPMEYIREISAVLFFALAADVLLFPFLVSVQGITAVGFEQQMSSDVFIYSLLPSVLPAELRYFMTFSIVPSLLFTLGVLVAPKQKVMMMMKQAM